MRLLSTPEENMKKNRFFFLLSKTFLELFQNDFEWKEKIKKIINFRIFCLVKIMEV